MEILAIYRKEAVYLWRLGMGPISRTLRCWRMSFRSIQASRMATSCGAFPFLGKVRRNLFVSSESSGKYAKSAGTSDNQRLNISPTLVRSHA